MTDRAAQAALVTFVVSACLACSDEGSVAGLGRVLSVTLSPTETTLAIGESKVLEAVLEDEAGIVFVGRALNWTSSDTAIARVSDSVVDAIAVGTARITASTEGVSGSAEVTVVTPPNPGDPLPGLTPEQLLAFEGGRQVFERLFTEATGLGPTFNAEGCAACHTFPSSGGHGATITEVHASVFSGASCDPLTAQGGFVFQQNLTQALIDALSVSPPEPIPSGAQRATRTTSDMFGFGLLDAVPDGTILALEDPDDADGDGISGRANRSLDGRVGRFGRKAQVPTLSEFNEGAFLNEQGITSPNLLEENTFAGTPIPPGVDTAAEPEIDADEFAMLNDFVRFLAAPASAALSESAELGQQLFSAIGCDACHVPSLFTGPNPIDVFANREVRAYTDLLLHDMGSQLADICLGQVATPAEFRTEPLMGLSLANVFLHDGRATSVEEAILLHGGEAAASSDAFRGLPDADRASLLEFLSSL